MIIETPRMHFRRVVPETCSIGRVYVWLPRDSKPYVTRSLASCARKVLLRQRGSNSSLSAAVQEHWEAGAQDDSTTSALSAYRS